MKQWFIILLIGFSINSYSQDKISVLTLNNPITVDGQIDPIWSNADSISGFYQLEPDYGSLSTRNTIVKSAQFEDKIYFLFICYINSFNEIAAKIQQRDKLNLNDDVICIMLDTYHDNHNAFLFQVNPLGTISDAKITDDGKGIDYLWDTKWRAKTKVDSAFWAAEIMIPLKGIQFDAKQTTWGCNFSRSIRISHEISWWLKVTENFRVSQSGQLTDIKIAVKKQSSLELFPYGTIRYEDSDLTGIHAKFKGDMGLDMQYQYSSNLKANITINPDFATVEGDKEQINLTPWELKFPEKRLFFQDGNEMFGTRIQTFYSRRIGDILIGSKTTGKFGKYQFNGLYAYTREDTLSSTPKAHFSAFKMKRDVFKSSTIGVTYTDKIADTVAIHTFSVDYVFNLGKEWKLTGQYVASVPGEIMSHSAWYVRFAKENNIYHYHVRYTELGSKFSENVNETGFVNDDDRKEIDSDVNYKFWLNGFIKYIALSGKNNIFWSQTGKLRSWYLTYGSRCYFNNRLSLDFYYNNEYKDKFKDVTDDYYNHFYQVIAGYNTDENSFAEIRYQRGINFDRNFNFLEFSTDFQLFKKVAINYELKNISFKPDPDNESTLLNVLGVSYYYTNDLWLRVFIQHSTHTDRIYFYGLAGWRFKPPFGAVYLIYNSDNYQEFLTNNQINSHIIFLKLTYPINVIK